MKGQSGVRARALRRVAVTIGLLFGTRVGAQDTPVARVDMAIGRSFPISSTTPITRVSIANQEVADVIVISEREVVINAYAAGETDAILWQQNGTRLHYRISVHSPADRMQIWLGVKIAEVRKDRLRELGVSAVYREGGFRVGTQFFRSDNPFDEETGNINLPTEGRFLSILTDFSTDNLLALIDAEAQKGNAKLLAEPNLIAGNKENASFLAGGELPIPVVQSGASPGQVAAPVTILFREFGIRLTFNGEIISDSLIKLNVRPEVSSLDFANAILLQGFRIPAFRTRKIESTLDVRRNESFVISGLFSTQEERVQTGVPLLMEIPILGQLFSSTRFQRNESELIIIVTPVIIDPMRPRPQDVIRFRPDTTRPARDALVPRLPGRRP